MSQSNFNESARVGRPSMCRSCGAIVGAGESECGVCGAPLARVQAEAEGSARPPAYDNETIRFARAVLTRPAPFTFIFLIANVFIYLLMTFTGGADGQTLVAYGAKLNARINAGEWWRFVTPVFLHISVPGLGPMHLLVNMYGLWILGPYVEKLYGSAKFVFFWIATGVAGVVASYYAVQPEMQNSALERFLFKSFDIPSAGASGALFGLVGVLFVFGLKFRHELPQGFKRAFGTGMLPIILINLFIGYAGRGMIDNAAHMGGLFAGATFALLVDYKRPGLRGPVAYAWHALQVAALALVVISFAQVARHFDVPPPNIEGLRETAAGSGVRAYIEAMNEGQRTLMLALAGNAGAADGAIERLYDAPPLDEQAAARRDELRELLERARDWAQLAPEERRRQPALQQAQRLMLDYQEWQERFGAWVQAEGPRYGFALQTPSPSPAAGEAR